METNENIIEAPVSHKNLYEALSSFQGEVEDPKKDGENPHLKSKYATLTSVLKAVRPLLKKNGLAVVQIVGYLEDGKAKLITRLAHTSGEAIESELILPPSTTMQSLGSAITYARRYTLTAILGISGDDDDDGAAASKRASARKKEAPTTPDATDRIQPNANTAQLRKLLEEKGLTIEADALAHLKEKGFEAKSLKNLSEKQVKMCLALLLTRGTEPERAANVGAEVHEDIEKSFAPEFN